MKNYFLENYVWKVPLLTTILIIPVSKVLNILLKPDSFGFIFSPILLFLILPFLNWCIVVKMAKRGGYEYPSRRGSNAFLITWGFQIVLVVLIFLLEGLLGIEPEDLLFS